MTGRGESAAREALLDAVRRLDAAGLNVNASGNLSVRAGRGLLVTPSGIAPDAMTVDDLVALEDDGTPVEFSGRTPTSEWRLHVEVYRRRPDVAAIVHTHAPEATAASTTGKSVPAVHYVVARFGGTELACAPYATYGSAELAAAVADTLGAERSACLMANHGSISIASDLPTAVTLTRDLEWFCGVYRRALAIGDPTVLADREVAEVAERFRSYGQPPQPPN
jgi:L-fuculose-phosphate aldolase